MFQASPDLCITFSICGPVLVFSFSASTDSISVCLLAQASSSSEDLNSLLVPSVNKNTLEGNNHFPTTFFPLPPFKNKVEAPGVAFLCRCHATTWSPDLTRGRLYCSFRIDTRNSYAMDFFEKQNLGRKKLVVLCKQIWCVSSAIFTGMGEKGIRQFQSHMAFETQLHKLYQPREFFVEILFHSCVNLMITPFFLSRFYLDLRKVIWRGKEGQLHCYL